MTSPVELAAFAPVLESRSIVELASAVLSFTTLKLVVASEVVAALSELSETVDVASEVVALSPLDVAVSSPPALSSGGVSVASPTLTELVLRLLPASEETVEAPELIAVSGAAVASFVSAEDAPAVSEISEVLDELEASSSAFVTRTLNDTEYGVKSIIAAARKRAAPALALCKMEE
jgi:hypothetical protein